jgi:O-antigen/teichoic acid export membrane protein
MGTRQRTKFENHPRLVRLVEWALRFSVGFVLWYSCPFFAILIGGSPIDTEEMPLWRLLAADVFLAAWFLTPVVALVLGSRKFLRRRRRRQEVPSVP